MATARSIIKSTLRKIHVLGKGAPLDADEANDALETLNDMLSIWSAEGDMIFTESKETFNLTGAVSYTIGSGGTFNTVRPQYISAAFVSQGDTDYSLGSIDNQQYSRISQKDIASIPECYYYDAGYPLATLYLYPKPSSVSTITLYSFKPLTAFTNLDTDFAMPEEYKAALIYNLAIWIAPEYERDASMEIKRIARNSKDAVVSQNKRNENFISMTDVPSRGGQTGSINQGYLV